jgi:hypothetical protein
MRGTIERKAGKGGFAMNRAAVALVLMLAVLSGCARPEPMPSPQSYPYRHAMFDYRVAWKTVPTPDGVVVEGLLQNVRWAYVTGADLTVTLLKKDGRKIVGRDIPVPLSTRMGETVPFRVVLRNGSPEPGDEMEFLIHYKATEGQEGGMDWRSRFRADAVTGRVLDGGE